MQIIPNSFPQIPQDSFFLLGKDGLLEVASSWPDQNLAKAIMIICHPHPLHGGAMTNKVVTTVMRASHHEGLATLRFNFRGVGKSEGTYGYTQGEADDLKSVLSWVLEVLPETPIFISGFSFGSYIAAKVANEKNFASLIISIAPPVNHFTFSYFSEILANWWVIQGDKDEIVPFDQVEAWVEEMPNFPQLITLKDGTHFFHGKLLELQQNIQMIIKKMI